MEPEPEPMRRESMRPGIGVRRRRPARARRRRPAESVYEGIGTSGDSIKTALSIQCGGYTPGDFSEKYRAPSVLLLPKRKTS